MTGSLVFNSMTNGWKTRTRRKTGRRVIRQEEDAPEMEVVSEDA